MSTSWVNRWRHRGDQTKPSPIIALRWWGWLALALVTTLVGCSNLRLGYNQGPTAAYWWLDRYVDFNEAQTPAVRQDLNQFWAWHRSQALPLYQTHLVRWQGMLGGPVSADQICSEFDWVQAQLRQMGDQGVAPLTRWALSLQPEQLQRMQARFDDRNQDFSKDHLQGDPNKRLQKRLKDNQKRWGDWYGELSTSQRALLQQQIMELPWDAALTLEERRWRQADLMATVRLAQSQPAQAPAALTQHLLRYQTSSTPARAAQRELNVRARCAQFADVHNSMSADQRKQAQAKLQGYIDDVRALQARAAP